MRQQVTLYLWITLVLAITLIALCLAAERPRRKANPGSGPGGLAKAAFFIGMLWCTGASMFSTPPYMGGKKAQCLSELKQLGLASIQYSEANDNRLPLATNWLDVTEPLVKHKAKCPLVAKGVGYGYQVSLAGKEPVGEPAEVWMLTESADESRNVVLSSESQMVIRHSASMLLCYEDTHARYASWSSQMFAKWADGRNLNPTKVVVVDPEGNSLLSVGTGVALAQGGFFLAVSSIFICYFLHARNRGKPAEEFWKQACYISFLLAIVAVFLAPLCPW